MERQRREAWNPSDEDIAVIKEMVDNHSTLEEIAQKFKVNRMTVHRKLSEINHPTLVSQKRKEYRDQRGTDDARKNRTRKRLCAVCGTRRREDFATYEYILCSIHKNEYDTKLAELE